VRPGGSSLMLVTTNQEYGGLPPSQCFRRLMADK
jgi:hypothetical protein